MQSIVRSPKKFDPTDRLLLAVFVFFLTSIGLFLVQSVDLGLHVIVGGYTLENGLPETNVFSPFNADHPILQHEWAFQVLTYSITALAGFEGLSWARLIIVLAIGLILHRTLRPGPGYAVAVGSLALGLFVAAPRYVWRPELFSMLLLAAVLMVLIDFVEGRKDRLVILPLVFALWANFHGYFLAGLIVLGCFAAGELAEAFARGKNKGPAIRLIRIGVLCAIATILNPYHIEGALYPFRALIELFTVDSQFNTSIAELMPPETFHNLWAVKAWIPLLIVFGVSTAIQGRKVRFAYLLTALAIWLMARSTFRNIGLFGMTLGVLAAVQWQVAAVWKSLPELIARYSRWGALTVFLVLLSMACFIGTNRLNEAQGSARMVGAGVAYRLDPPARKFIDELIPADSQVFNSFSHGSRYLGWFYPKRLPFIDGNGDGYPPEFYAEYQRVNNGAQPFDPYAKRYGIHWVYLALDEPLAHQLYDSSTWHPVFLDGDGIIFVDQTEAFADIRRSFDLRADLVRGVIAGWEPTPRPHVLRRSTPRRELRLWKFLNRIGERRAAGRVLLHVKERFPKDVIHRPR